jgi:hypothetical protein
MSEFSLANIVPTTPMLRPMSAWYQRIYKIKIREKECIFGRKKFVHSI